MFFPACLTPLLAEAAQVQPRLLNPSIDVPLPVVMLVLGVIFIGTLAISKFSLKIGIPAILGVLLLGLAINPGTRLISDHSIEQIHVLSLSLLLFYAGLQTDMKSIRGFLEYGLILALGGVIVSSLLLGLFIWFVASPTGSGIEFGFTQIPLAAGMLIAACLGSTDAGATLSVLRDVKHLVPARLSALLEFESSVNDPTAILFLGLVVGLSTASGTDLGMQATVIQEVQRFVQNIGSGVLLGVVLGYFSRYVLNHLVQEKSQLLVLGLSVAMLTYGAATQLGGSGFIAVYVTGLFLSNNYYSNQKICIKSLQQALLPFNTMTEIIVFLSFGLVMDPSRVFFSLDDGSLIALFLMLVARPISILMFQPFSPFRLKDSLFVSWCGLRGAVPLALTFVVVDKIPKISGINPAIVNPLIDNAKGVIFCVVILSLAVQGCTLPHVCRWLGLDGDSGTGGTARPLVVGVADPAP
ncbi:MAG: cation:proton antiporter [Cyanobacteriota bacterium]